MNFRLTTVLIGAVILIGTVLLVRTFVVGPPAPDTLLVGLGDAKAEQIDEVVVERTDPAATLKFKRVSETEWEMTEPIRAKANGGAVKALVESVLKAKPTVFAETGTNPATRGLDPPSLKVTLRAGDARSGTLNLGNVTFGGGSAVVFVTTTVNPDRPVAVSRRDLEPLFRQELVAAGGKAGDLVKWTADYRTPAVFPSDSRAVGEDVASVKLELPNQKKELALTHRPGGGWLFDQPAGWGAADAEGDSAGSPGTFTGVRRLLGALTSVSAATPADFIDSPKDLKEYGLNADNPDLVKVTMTTRDKQAATVYIGKTEAAGPPPHPGLPPAGGKVYVRIEGQPGVIRATAGDLSGLVGVIRDPSPLRDRTLVNLDRARVDGIDILLPGQPADKPTKLRRAGPLKQWALFGGPGDPHPAAAARVDKLLDVVLARRSIKGFPAPDPANFTAVRATVLVWADGFAPAPGESAEPVKQGEPVKLEFGRKDGDTVYVRRTRPGLPPDEYTIPAQVKVGQATETVDALAAVTPTRLDLLDPSLPSFSDAAPTRIAVTGANNYTLVRDPAPDPVAREPLWRFAPADPRKGQVADAPAVADMIGLLGTSQSAFGRFVEEDPAEAKLAEYGLAPPRLKVVIGLASGGPESGFEFGNDTADPDKVYARVTGRKAVFTLQRRVFDRFLNPDLRDRTIFRAVNAPAVNKVELRGWGGAGFVTELVFEKNAEGVWTATKAPPGYTVDPAKVSAFVELLANLRVKAFEKGVPDGKHGFGDPKQNLAATLHWPGGAVALNIGASPDGGATYYGWSSWLPQSDPVFTMDAAAFKPFKDSTGGFAK